jgi:hypothetical protein
MSNSYNRKFGENAHADELLQMLGLTREDFGRYRDTWLTDRGTTVTVYTRMATQYAPHFNEQKQRLGQHPQIVDAWDDTDDNTYHYVKFLVPTANLSRTKELYRIQGEPRTVHQLFEDLRREMDLMTPEQMAKDPRMAADIAAIQQLHNQGSGILDTTDDDLPAEFKPPILRER